MSLETLKSQTLPLVENGFAECLGLLEKLVACKSLSGQEKECADSLLEWLRDHDIPACTDTRGSVIAASVPVRLNFEKFPEEKNLQRQWFKELQGHCERSGVKILAFNAHMDIVAADNPEKWQSPPFKTDCRDGRIYGRGTCDMKGALAAMAYALVLMQKLDRQFPRNFVVIGCFCTEEEAGEGLAFKELCEEFNLKPDRVLLGEPSQMQIARGQRGKLEFFVETTGKTAHTSVPEVGENAAYKMARALLAIEWLDACEREKHGLEPENMLNRNTVVATSMRSWPESKSFVPDRAQIHVTARTALDCDLNEIARRLKESEHWPTSASIQPLIYQKPSYTGKVSVWPSDHPAWETSTEHVFFKDLADLYHEFLGAEPVSKIWPFSTDGVYSAGMAEIPTLGIGPGLENCAHIIDEWVSENELKQALAIYTALPFVKT